MEETTLTGDQHLSCKDTTDDGVTWQPHHYWKKVLVILDGERDSKGRGKCLRAMLRGAYQIQLLSQEQEQMRQPTKVRIPFTNQSLEVLTASGRGMTSELRRCGGKSELRQATLTADRWC
ncbi:hypothetical protein BDN67DRAFT_975656, partial [Paxillus ammoniavirescens]